MRHSSGLSQSNVLAGEELKVSLSYFGAPPSTDNPSLVGQQLLKSRTVDAAGGTITLPLYLGYMTGTKKGLVHFARRGRSSTQDCSGSIGFRVSASFRTAGLCRRQNGTLTNPPPQTMRARDERRDQYLSVLEICREFVSWRRSVPLLSLRRSPRTRVICVFC